MVQIYKDCGILGLGRTLTTQKEVFHSDDLKDHNVGCGLFGMFPTPASIKDVPNEWELPCGTGDAKVKDGKCQTVCSASEFVASGSFCTPVKECDINEYETKSSTMTSDRECSLLTVCSQNQYQIQASTATSDRKCDFLTECSRNQYESQASTATSDRACKLRKTCELWEDTVIGTSTTDNACSLKFGCGGILEGHKYWDASTERCESTTSCQVWQAKTLSSPTTDAECINKCSTDLVWDSKLGQCIEFKYATEMEPLGTSGKLFHDMSSIEDCKNKCAENTFLCEAAVYDNERKKCEFRTDVNKDTPMGRCSTCTAIYATERL